MTIHFQCHCGQKMKAEERKIGKTFPCPVCGGSVTVPAADQRTPRHSEPLSEEELISSCLSDMELVTASATNGGVAMHAAHEPDDAPGSPPDPSPRQRELPEHPPNTADAARNLFLSIGAKEREEALSGREALRSHKSRHEKKPGIELGGLLREGGRAVLPGAGLTVAGCLLAYWLASSVMGIDRGWPELGQVSGVVRLDGQPLPDATVTFRPLSEEDANKISASVGVTDAEGRYTLMYVRDAAGAAVGTHQVLIEASLPNGAPLLPPRYNAATTLTKEVAADGNTFDFDLTSDLGKAR